jgi:GNAT superfamily N-acetyltransferase
MTRIERFRPEDRPTLEGIYRDVFGDRAAESLRERWEWMHDRNPARRDGAPLVMVARDEATPVGMVGMLPIRLAVNGTEIDAAWGVDALVASSHRGRSLGRALVSAMEQCSGASLAVGLTDDSFRLMKLLRWPYVGTLPRFAKSLSRRIRAEWKASPESARERGGAAARWRRLAAVLRPRGAVHAVERFDASFTRLWERVSPTFALAGRRDAAYLQWRYGQAPHARYSTIALSHGGETAAWAVYRHAQDGRWRATVLVDFLADPDEPQALATLIDAVEREARRAGSDVVRAFATHATYRACLLGAGFDVRDGSPRLIAKVTALPVPPEFYASTDRWHVTRGDSDADR